MFHDLKIVGNDDIGKVELLLEVFEKIQDLSPDGNIQRRNRLIEDDAFRHHRKRPCDGNALALPSAELMRILHSRLNGKSGELQQLLRSFYALLFADTTLDQHRFGDDFPHAHTGAE